MLQAFARPMSLSSNFLYIMSLLQALKGVWKEHRQRNGLKDEEPVAHNLLTSIELVLDNHNQLVEMNRLPGENEVTRDLPPVFRLHQHFTFFMSFVQCLSGIFLLLI